MLALEKQMSMISEDGLKWNPLITKKAQQETLSLKGETPLAVNFPARFWAEDPSDLYPGSWPTDVMS